MIRTIRQSMLVVLGGLALLLILLPVTGLIWRGLHQQSWLDLETDVIRQALFLSLETSLISLMIVVLLGTPLAYVLARRRFFGRRLLNAVVELPIILPPAVAGIALLVTFGRRGVIGRYLTEVGISIAFSRIAVIIAQTFVAIPFYIRAAQIGFSKVDRDIEEQAMVDGASPFWRFVYITLPLTWRALMSGALLSWARALGEFGATIIFAGSFPGRTRTMPLLIYNLLERDIQAAIRVALLLVALAITAAVLIRLLLRDEAIEL